LRRVAAARCVEEARHCCAVLVAVDRDAWGGGADVGARADRELPDRCGCAADGVGDLGEGQSEQVVQYPGGALGGGERLEHHEQRPAHRVVQADAVRRVGVVGGELDNGLGQPRADVELAA